MRRGDGERERERSRRTQREPGGERESRLKVLVRERERERGERRLLANSLACQLTLRIARGSQFGVSAAVLSIVLLQLVLG